MSARASIRAAAMLLLALAPLAGCGRKTNAGGYATDTRNAIRIVGSPLAFPLSAAVAEQFARSHPDFRAPVVESTGTARGIALFCGGVGLRYPDIVGADRPLTAAEAQDCLRHGVTEVVGVAVGRVADEPGGRTRPLLLYVKRQHLPLLQGLRPLLAGYAAAWGPGGALADRGLLVAPAAERARNAAALAALTPIDLRAIR